MANVLTRLYDRVTGRGERRRAAAAANVVAGLQHEIINLRSRYDAAQTATGNELHWANADHLSPNAANSADVRRTLRARSRYEITENNPYLKGAALTIANDFVGSGPKLRVTDPRFSRQQQQAIEKRFADYAKAIKLRQKLWRMRLARIVDGEAFLAEVFNPKITNPVKVDFKVLEGDQIASPYGEYAEINDGREPVDGIRFDSYENPSQYHVLKVHPGAAAGAFLSSEGSWVAARFMIHWFRQDRGWSRGIPEITASLPLCAMLRRYTLAVIEAAEAAASFSGVLESDGPVNTGLFGSVAGMTQADIEQQYFDAFPILRGMFVTLPPNSKLKQVDAEQPTAVYDKFVDCLLREIMRPLLIPFNLAVGFSGGYNFASGTLDKQIYWGGQKAERYSANDVILDPVYLTWWREAIDLGVFDDPLGVDGVSNQFADLRFAAPAHSWGWDTETPHADPLKNAMADRVLWEDGHLSDSDIQHRLFNRDAEDHYAALAEQRDRREDVGARQPGEANEVATETNEDEDGD
jgi:capsid protein